MRDDYGGGRYALLPVCPTMMATAEGALTYSQQ